MLISYGSCQFPTLGFVVERFLAIERFRSEPYWKIKVMNIHDDISVEFRWNRIRLFEELPCQIFLDMCQENPIATVIKVTSKPKSKWRPLPLDTIVSNKINNVNIKFILIYITFIFTFIFLYISGIRKTGFSEIAFKCKRSYEDSRKIIHARLN